MRACHVADQVRYRHVTLVYKVSRPVPKSRLGVLWRNAIRLRYLHELSFGPDLLRFRAYDQKPLWHNSLSGRRTLACMGTREVEVRENHAASRQRFTAMTKCVDIGPAQTPEESYGQSGGSRDPRRLVILFKGAGSANVRASLSTDKPDTVLLQFAPKGSYRLEHVLEFLDWDVGLADEPADGSAAEVVCLDWFAPHLDAAVDTLITSRGHVPLKYPGGSTPWVAPPNTHAHAFFDKEYPAGRHNFEICSCNACLHIRSFGK
jgi:hypothetical protein